MNITPVLNASVVIQLHLLAALLALGLGAVQLAAAKGTASHRRLGYLWAGMMAVVAISSFFIFELRLWGPFSPIHLLSLFTLVTLYLAVQAARHNNINRHQRMMRALYIFALLLTGAFTFFPGRLLHQLVMANLWRRYNLLTFLRLKRANLRCT